MIHCKCKWIPEFTNKSRPRMLDIKCDVLQCMQPLLPRSEDVATVP